MFRGAKYLKPAMAVQRAIPNSKEVDGTGEGENRKYSALSQLEPETH
jgi:hypothetical protein